MWFAPVEIEQMDDLDTAAHQGIGHERPVAPPPQGLRAHDRQPFAGLGPRDECFNGTTKCRCVHVVGVAAKRCVSERRVPRRCMPVAPATQLLALPLVSDSGGSQTHSNCLASELWMAARTWEP